MRGFVVGSLGLIFVYVLLTNADKAVAANNTLARGFQRVFGKDAGDVAAIPDITRKTKPASTTTSAGSDIQLLAQHLTL